MLSFGQTKNSLQKLKSCLKKMEYFDCSTPRFSPKDLQEHNLRILNNEIFLPLLHFILIDYSGVILKEIVDRFPNIRYKDDRNFLENALNIGRDIFKCSGTLNVDQFLTNKYFQKKLEFISSLAKAVYDKAEAYRKNKLKEKDKQIYQPTAGMEQFQFNNDLDDQEEEVPMTITAQPIKLDVQQFIQNPGKYKESVSEKGKGKGFGQINTKDKSSKFSLAGEQFNEWEVEKALQQRHPTPVHFATRKPIDQPIPITDKTKGPKYSTNSEYGIAHHQQRQGFQKEEEEEEEEDDDARFEKFRLDQNKNKIKTVTGGNQNTHQESQGRNQKHQERVKQSPVAGDYVSRQQFNELLNLIRVVSETVNELSDKFVMLEGAVNTQMANMNARTMMLESSVRLLKDNL